MDEQQFVPALIELRNSSPETVVQYFHKVFTEISKMNPRQVTAAFQTVKCVAESSGLEQDVAVRHTLSALHQRMVSLVHGPDLGLDSNGHAVAFCALLGIEMEFRHRASDYLTKHRVI